MAKGKRFVVVVTSGTGKGSGFRSFTSDSERAAENAANDYVARAPRDVKHHYARRQYEES
jgi:hypothetical protein